MTNVATSHQPDRTAGEFRPIALLLAIGLIVHLIPVLLSSNLGIGLDDMYQYDMLARSLADGEGFRWYSPQDLKPLRVVLRRFTDLDLSQLAEIQDPRGVLTSFRAPLYPGFLSLPYRLVEPAKRFLAARLIQAIIMSALGPLTYAIAHELGARRRWSLAAGVMVSLWPLLVSLPLALATENLFLPLTAAGTWLLLRAESHHSKWLILGAGISLGLAALTRSVIVGFPGLVALWYLTRGQRRRALYLLLPMALLITPWVVRNSLLHGQLTLIESSLGYNLYLGYHPDGTGTFEFGPSLELLTIVDDSERDVTGRLGAWTFIKSDPARVPGLVLWKLGHLWGLEDRAFSYLYSNDLLGRWPPLMVASALILTSLPLIITLPLAILGWALLERSRHWQLLTLLFAWYIGVHLLIMAEERFHFALVPMLAALAAQLMSQRGDLLSQLRRGNSSTRRRLLLGALLVVLALGNWGLELGRNADQYRTLIEPGGWRSGLNY